MGNLSSSMFDTASPNGSEKSEVPTVDDSEVILDGNDYILAKGGLRLRKCKRSISQHITSPSDFEYNNIQHQNIMSDEFSEKTSNSESEIEHSTLETILETPNNFFDQNPAYNDIIESESSSSMDTLALNKFKKKVSKKFFNSFSSKTRKSKDNHNDNLYQKNKSEKSFDMNYTQSMLPNIGFSFSPAGLLLAYHFGVMDFLKEMGFIDQSTPLSGSSSGSLACFSSLSSFDSSKCLELLQNIILQVSTNGTIGKVQGYLKSILEAILPENIDELANNRPSKVTVGITEVFPLKGRFISSFHGRDDVIECLLASCNIPFYFSASPFVKFRGKRCVDGLLSTSRKHFGCPPTNSQRQIKVVAFKTFSVSLEDESNDLITPEMYIYDSKILKFLEQSRSTQEWMKAISVSDNKESSSSIEKTPKSDQNTSPSNYKKIASHIPVFWDQPPPSVSTILGIPPPYQFDYHFTEPSSLIKHELKPNEILKYSLHGGDERISQNLFDLGRLDAFRWLINEYVQFEDKLFKDWEIIYNILINNPSEEINNNDANGTEKLTKLFTNTTVQKLVDANIINSSFLHLLSKRHRHAVHSINSTLK